MKRNFLVVLAAVYMVMVGVSYGAEPVAPPLEDDQVALASALAGHSINEKDALGLASAAKMFRKFISDKVVD